MPAGDDPALTLGSALRRAREQSGQSVDEVSASTRIRATLVRDLEADRFDSSGGAVYARGHVRALAAAVGADLVVLLPLFDAQQAGGAPQGVAAEPLSGPVAPLSLKSSPLGRPLSDGPERSTPRWGVAAAVAVALLLVVLVVGTLRSPSRGSARAASTGPSPRATPMSPGTSTGAGAPPVRPSVPAATAAPLAGAQLLVSIVGGVSWVSIRNATGTLFEGVLPEGTARSFSDPSALDVKVGNAGAVTLRCGGRSSGRAGASGKVLQFSCTSTGLTPA